MTIGKITLGVFGGILALASLAWAEPGILPLVAGAPQVPIGRQVESDGGVLVINNLGSGVADCECRRVGSVLQAPVLRFRIAPIFGSYRVDAVPDGEAWTTWCAAATGTHLSVVQAENLDEW